MGTVGSASSTFSVNPGWYVLLRDLGISVVDVMRRAQLAPDHLLRNGATLTAADYLRLWQALDDEAGDPTLPLRLVGALSFEMFDPALFAAMCSPDLTTALERIRRFKPLIGPLALTLTAEPDATEVRLDWLPGLEPPDTMRWAELAFFVQLARLATRTPVEPVRVTSVVAPDPAAAYADYFGVAVATGDRDTVCFAAADLRRPFLTARAEMWGFFEPELRRRLDELDRDAPLAERVRGALLELLPSGRGSVADVARQLAVSPRTLQRRLHGEGDSFQGVLDRTRADLARHYLRTTEMTGAEIGLLLGFDDPNSFSRAFHGWTGDTPERTRAALRGR